MEHSEYIKNQLSDESYDLLVWLTVLQTLQMFTGWLNFFYTCNTHENEYKLSVANTLRYVCPIITGIIVPFATMIFLISYASKGAFDDSIITLWFVICAILQIPCIFWAYVFISGARD